MSLYIELELFLGIRSTIVIELLLSRHKLAPVNYILGLISSPNQMAVGSADDTIITMARDNLPHRLMTPKPNVHQNLLFKLIIMQIL
jgi:hypothetical protein